MIRLYRSIKPPFGTPIDFGNPLARGLTGAYALNEAGGTSVYDATGRGNNGTFQGTPTWGYGQFGPGVLCDATNEAIRVPGSTINAAEGSVFVLAKVGWASTSTTFANITDTDTSRITLFKTNETGKVQLYADGRQSDFTLIPFSANTWVAFGVSWNRSRNLLAVYQNGVALTAATNSGTWGSNATGTYAWYGNRFATSYTNLNGTIALACSWDRTLSAAQHAAIAAAPFALFLNRDSPYFSNAVASSTSTSVGIPSTLIIGAPSLAATLAASTGIASTATIGPPVATLTMAASVGRPSGLVIGTPVGSLTLAATIGIASGLIIGTPVANIAGGPLGASVGIASTLTLGTPTLSGSLGAGVGIASTLTVGTPVAGLTLPASVGIASGLVIGSPTASGTQAAIVGMASTLLIGPPVASGSFATLAGPTQITTTLVQDGPRPNALTQLGPDPHQTFGAA
jgi:hypothetical protein